MSRARLLAGNDAGAADSWYGHYHADDSGVPVPAGPASPEGGGREELPPEVEAARQALDTASRLVRRLEAALVEVAAFRAELLDRSRPQLIELSLAISRHVLTRLVERDRAAVADMARAALTRVHDATDVRVRVNPVDFDALRPADQASATIAGLVADPRVPPGGCRVESSFGEIDAGIDAQLGEISRALLESDVIPEALP